MPDEEADLPSIDYDRAVLAQEERERQQACTPRGEVMAHGGDDGAPTFPLLGKNNTGQPASAGWPVLYMRDRIACLTSSPCR